MRVLTYDRLARDFRRAWAMIEDKGEEVVVTRRRRRVARIVPESPPSTALGVFGDLHGLLGESAGAILARALAGARERGCVGQTLDTLRDPWVS